MGIRLKALIIIGVLSLIAITAMGFVSYRFSMENAMTEAKTKSMIVLNYVHSTRKYLKNTQRPLVMELIEEDRFYPELMSGFVVARGTYELFQSQLPEYRFKQATLDPLLPKNKADADEVRIIETFRGDPSLTVQDGTIEKDGEDYFYMAQPIKIDNQKCLNCHGDPAKAPKDQVEIYGTSNGYNWKMDDTVAAFVVYVPIRQALDAALKSTQNLVMIGGGCILFALVVVWFFLDRSIVSPILRLSQRAEDISLGKNIGKKVEAGSAVEISRLANAIDRLRISILVILKRKRKT